MYYVAPTFDFIDFRFLQHPIESYVAPVNLLVSDLWSIVWVYASKAKQGKLGIARQTELRQRVVFHHCCNIATTAMVENTENSIVGPNIFETKAWC